MKVLNLVTTPRPFFQNQVKILKQLGVVTKEIEVPNEMPRSITDYLLFYPRVIYNSMDHYDLVHANYGNTAPFAVAQPKRPIVLTLWGSDLRLFLQNSRKGWIARNLASLESFDEVIVRSEEMRRELKREFNIHGQVIPSGVDLEEFQPIDKKKAKKRLGWPPQVKHVLFPYSPSREVKNYPLAKKVVNEVNERTDFEVKLEVVQGVQHEKIPIYMNAADVMLLTSKSEGSPNTVKEAMACNTPVVSTDVGDVNHMLKGVEKSKVCKNRDELVEGIVEILKRSDSSNGRKRIKELELGLEQMGYKIFEVYQKALED